MAESTKTDFINLAREKGYSESKIRNQLKLSDEMIKDGLNPSYEILFTFPPAIGEDPPYICKLCRVKQ